MQKQRSTAKTARRKKAEDKKQATMVGHHFDGRVAQMILSDGRRLNHDVLSKGTDGFVRAHWHALGGMEMKFQMNICRATGLWQSTLHRLRLHPSGRPVRKARRSARAKAGVAKKTKPVSEPQAGDKESHTAVESTGAAKKTEGHRWHEFAACSIANRGWPRYFHGTILSCQQHENPALPGKSE